MTFRFLHLADLHLDSAYGGREATRRRLREATMEALHAAASFAIREDVHAVLVAGDAFDEGRLGYDARSVWRREVRRVTDAGVHVVWCTGNHDPGLADGTARGLGLDGLERVHVAFDGEPRTFTVDREGAPVGTVSTAGHAHGSVADDLASRLVPPPGGDVPHVAMLHTQVGGSRGSDAHARYAPSTVEALASSGFAYWALGHVHRRGRVAPDVNAWYPGNLQGRSFRETGAKGGLLVEVDRDGPTSTPAFVPFAPVEFAQVSVTRTEGEPHEADSLAERIAAELSGARHELVVRARLSGPCAPADRARFDDPETRRLIEDAVADEPAIRALDARVHEVELVLDAEQDASEGTEAGARLVDLERELMATPSALREAILLADEVSSDPEIGAALAPAFARSMEGDEARAHVKNLLAHGRRSLASDLLERLDGLAGDA